MKSGSGLIGNRWKDKQIREQDTAELLEKRYYEKATPGWSFMGTFVQRQSAFNEPPVHFHRIANFLKAAACWETLPRTPENSRYQQ